MTNNLERLREVSDSLVFDGELAALLFIEGALVVVDSAGEIIATGKNVEELFGYSEDELLGRSVEMLIPEELRARHIEHRKLFAQDPRPRPMGVGLNLQILHKLGGKIDVEVSLRPLKSKICNVTLVTLIRRRRGHEFTS